MVAVPIRAKPSPATPTAPSCTSTPNATATFVAKLTAAAAWPSTQRAYYTDDAIAQATRFTLTATSTF